MAKLHVYVTETCWACQEARSIVAEVKPQFPDMEIELRDLNDERRPSQVFATPTYILDERTIFLGNPTREELIQKLESAGGFPKKKE
jgi:alkyl hydroperoxide reductase subunit AhpF